MRRLRAFGLSIVTLSAAFAGLGVLQAMEPASPASAASGGPTWVKAPPTTGQKPGATFDVEARSGDVALPTTIRVTGNCTAVVAAGATADAVKATVTVTAIVAPATAGSCTVTAEVAGATCGTTTTTSTSTTSTTSTSTTTPSTTHPPSSPPPNSSVPKSSVPKSSAPPSSDPGGSSPKVSTSASSPAAGAVKSPAAADVSPTDCRTITATVLSTQAPCSIDYVPLKPTRVLETRNPERSQGRNIQPVGYTAGVKPPGGVGNVIRVKVADKFVSPGKDLCGVPIPSTGVAAAINVAGVDVRDSGWIRVWDCSTPQPATSNVNLVKPDPRAPLGVDADARANLVITGLDQATGEICIVSLTSMEIFADLIGYFPTGATYVPLAPKRVVETRPQFNDLFTGPRLVANQPAELALERNGGVLSSTSKYVAINVTGETPDADGTLSVYDCDAGTSTAQSIKLEKAVDATPSLVIAKVNARKTLCVLSTTGVSLIVDLFGEFGATTRFQLFPAGTILLDQKLAAGETSMAISATAMFGGADVDAAFLKVTTSGGTDNGFLSVRPCGSGAVGTSSVNVAQFGPGTSFPTSANISFAQTDAAGQACLFSQKPGNAQVKVEAFGFWPRVPLG